MLIFSGKKCKDQNDLFIELKKISRGNNTPIKYVRFRSSNMSGDFVTRSRARHDVIDNKSQNIHVDKERYYFMQELQKMGLIQEKSKFADDSFFPPSYELTSMGETLLASLRK